MKKYPSVNFLITDGRGELIKLQKNNFNEIVFLWCLSNLNGINNMCVKFFGKKLAGSVPLEVRKLRF